MKNKSSHKSIKEKRRQFRPAVFPNAPKGRKGEKEMGILNCQIGWGPESRGERM
nr:MAG TPA_asm: hypothetical protein [Caudoviricetes sp.]